VYPRQSAGNWAGSNVPPKISPLDEELISEFSEVMLRWASARLMARVGQSMFTLPELWFVSVGRLGDEAVTTSCR